MTITGMMRLFLPFVLFFAAFTTTIIHGLTTDYDFVCADLKASHGYCACSTNPTQTLGTLIPSAFVVCDRLDLDINASFLGSDQVLQQLNVSEDFGSFRLVVMNYDTSTHTLTDCQTYWRNETCTSCTPCTGGIDINCTNIGQGNVPSTNGACLSFQNLMKYTYRFQNTTSSARRFGGGMMAFLAMTTLLVVVPLQ